MEIRGGVLVLFTHTLGERVSPFCSDAVNRTGRDSDSCAVLINDIGFVDRLRIYLQHGIEGVIGDYVYRKTCAERDMKVCQIGQIPDAHRIPHMLDPAAYESAARLLRQNNFNLYNVLLGDRLEPASRGEYAALMREIIVPSLISEYTDSNWKSKPFIYLERKQRNLSMRRLKCKTGSYSWCEIRTALRADPLNAFVLEDVDERLLRGKSGAPRCRAILLALFEEISLSHEKLLVRASIRARVALEEAQNLYLNVARGLPRDVPFRIRWSLSFGNEFWED